MKELSKEPIKKYTRGLTSIEYDKIHTYIRRNYPKASKCENEKCTHKSPKMFHWALKKGRTYSTNLEDYIQLCPSCHSKYDASPDKGERLSKIHKGKFYHGRQRRVAKHSLAGDFICEYTSVAEAARQNNMTPANIWHNLNGRRPFSGGFKWKLLN